MTFLHVSKASLKISPFCFCVVQTDYDTDSLMHVAVKDREAGTYILDTAYHVFLVEGFDDKVAGICCKKMLIRVIAQSMAARSEKQRMQTKKGKAPAQQI